MDQMLLVLLAKIVRTWKQALFIVQPETFLRWHRQGFKLFWKYKSRAISATPKISAETVALIQEMARDNRRLRSRTNPGRTPQAGSSCLQTHDSEVHESRAYHKATRTEVEHVLTHPCPADLGMRLPAYH